ncbi:MAG TPA: cyclic pyranopterin monophosphate synthase MoaC [bacterium]|nr:cyclic pyranopterin monophosphate synthase MoaC [bacterium]HNW16079.1 cyclic pyranopterin monophosphate synthase MoaC [bacterium]HNZ54596.1 cyclic pyranopterin monophosphate synthase MoaC [bacterium]HOB72682.1 cyclic pyranopterin monophosphate synthase MoaC [bacterium]HPV20523.1 cyclic pyranopterin monophosphate synthase MoaC [bacterium]
MVNKKLTHVDNEGKAKMVDVADKPDQLRTAVAEGLIALKPETVEMIRKNLMKKGDVLTVAQIAGIQAAKLTHQIIPLCHPLLITSINVDLSLSDKGVKAVSTVKCIGKTGIEMEALSAVSGALLGVYDMCKAVDKTMVIQNIMLIEKRKEDL